MVYRRPLSKTKKRTKRSKVCKIIADKVHNRKFVKTILENIIEDVFTNKRQKSESSTSAFLVRSRFIEEPSRPSTSSDNYNFTEQTVSLQKNTANESDDNDEYNFTWGSLDEYDLAKQCQKEQLQSSEAGPSTAYPSTSTFTIKEDQIIKEEHLEDTNLPGYDETPVYLSEVVEDVNIGNTESQDPFQTDNQNTSNIVIHNSITSAVGDQTTQITNEEETPAPYTAEYFDMIYETYKQAVNEAQYTQTVPELLELCVICAKDISRNRSKKSAKNFLDIILTVTLVDVTKYPFSLDCCGSCYSTLLQIKRFKNTVIEAGMIIDNKLNNFVKEYKRTRPHTALYLNTDRNALVNSQPIETVVVIQTAEAASIKFETEDLEEETQSNQVGAVLHTNQTNLPSSTTIQTKEAEQNINISANYQRPSLPSENIQSSIEQANSEHEENQIHVLNENNSSVLARPYLLRSADVVQTDGGTVIKCPICRKLYVKDYYEKHLLLHISKKRSEKGRKPCPICGKRFANFSSHLLSHQNVFVVCEICGKNIKRSAMSRHRQAHKDKEGDKIICSQCGRAFQSYAAFRKHEVYHEEKQHMCQVCGRSFYFPHALERHMRSHTGEKPFKCTYCSRTFSIQWNLNQHLRLHTNTKPYKCKLCSAAFRHNVTLKGHLRSAHSASEIAAVNNEAEERAAGSELATAEKTCDNNAATLEGESNKNLNTENQ